ncbi:MAG TPA: TerB family tellurite resistance protein [Chryseolinea sp.]|nr:TerB family tellurite resistance protein [Chryseolinea sp.]
MILHSTFPDFLLFLYVHMAQADNDYDPLELATIKTKMGKLYPENTDLERKLYGAIREYNSFDRSRLNEMIESSLKHFSNEATSRPGIYEDLYEIVQADGKLVQAETSSLENLKKFIDLYGEHHA